MAEVAFPIPKDSYQTLRTWTGRPRQTKGDPNKLRLGEIEPGRYVQDNWDLALFEPWGERKARRARERQGDSV